MSIFSLNVSDIVNALEGGSALSVLNSVTHPEYQIRNSDGTIALPISGVRTLSAGGSASITRAPVEKGLYQSINKVRDPGRIRVDVMLAGLTGLSGNIPNIFDLTLTTQSDALTTIETMLEATDTYDIDTPKATYESYDLLDWSYTVSSNSGVSLLTVHLEFQEVIQQDVVVLSSSQTSSSLTSNSLSTSTTGVSSTVTQATSSATTLDTLKSAWSKLTSATDTLVTTVSGAVTTSLTSAADTVGKTASELASSVSDKSSDIITSIVDTIT